MLLQGGGLEGGPAKPHTQTFDIQAAADHDDRNGEMSNGDDEGELSSRREQGPCSGAQCVCSAATVYCLVHVLCAHRLLEVHLEHLPYRKR